MSRPQRIISTSEVQIVVTQGELIEDYPKDPRSHSCLILDWGEANLNLAHIAVTGIVPRILSCGADYLLKPFVNRAPPYRENIVDINVNAVLTDHRSELCER
jgi:hypothetical protein